MKIKKTIPDWLIGVCITIFFLFITHTGIFDFTSAIEMKTFDLRAKMAAPEERNPDIEIVVISDDDLAELGRFPWPRNILAQGIQNLALAGARVIALNILFMEPEESAGLMAIKRLKDNFEDIGLAEKEPGLSFFNSLSQAVSNLDNDAKLAKAVKEARNVVLPVYFDTLSTGKDKEPPEFMTRHALKRIKGVDDEWTVSNLIWLSKIKPLLPSFAENAAGIGYLNLFPDADGFIRNQIHVLGYLKDIYFPSFPVAIVRAFKGLKDEDIVVTLGDGLNLRMNPSLVVKVPVQDLQMRTLINWNQGPSVAFHYTPFVKIFKNEIQTSLFRDKIVIIGPTALFSALTSFITSA
ncbi:CHASE2 domain-containing protein [Thermodesulfobacteriota bacterium]